MANVTEKDIINHLKEKIKFHQAEAKKIESLLSAFTGSPAQPKQKQVKEEETESVEQSKELKPVKKNKTAKKAPKAKVTKSLEIPSEYNPSLSWNSKIAFAINELGDGVFNEDIAAKITELEPGIELIKVSKQISGLLSVLKNKGALKAERTGKKDKYSLVR